ncbi:hypothetical protein ACH5RR_027146 [Cinchona calisaya]|uniref:Uncharacterized protein n=1 Tax=Cinchona calisaya TaxID=153742 RepID=A0ABD2Z5S4_9GENT
MNISTSEYSSGCASGWTMYLDPFPNSADQCNRKMPFDNYSHSKGAYVNEDEEDEDLSMLSDASSGPPHIHQDDGYSSEETRYASSILVSEPKKNKHRKKVKQQRKKQQNFHADDTASSSVLSFSKASHRTSFFENKAVHDNYLIKHDSGLSQGFSATHFKGNSVMSKHLGFFNPSMTGKAD